MRVVIAGAGNVGTSIAGDLLAGRHQVMLIELDPDLVSKSRGRLLVEWMEGDACEASVLRKASLATADGLVAATGDDKGNLDGCPLARPEFARPRAVARV